MSKATPTFRSVRWSNTINLILQAVLLLTLFAGLNYIVRHYSLRFDITHNQRYSLSAESVSYIKNLTQSVRIIVTIPDNTEDPAINQARKDADAILREYVYAASSAGHSRVTLDHVDIYQRPHDATALGINNPNTIYFISENNQRSVGIEELYLAENGRRTAFVGEQTITAAILDVSQKNKKKIYFLEGHGEMSLDSVSPLRGLSSLNQNLRIRNYDTATLNLAQTRKIPDDASLLVIAAPQSRYTPAEEELLRSYLSARAGRLLILLAPTYQHGLDNLFSEWGILVDDDLISESGTTAQNETGDLILHATETEHPTTLPLRSYRLTLRFGATRSTRPDPGRMVDNNLILTPLISTSDSAWGERDYRTQHPPAFNPETDIPGPLAVATSSERLPALAGLPFSVPGGRLIVMGNADWLANKNLFTLGNLSFLLSTVNWAADRDTQLNIPIRPIQYYQLSLTQAQLRNMRYTLVILIPAILALMGAIVYWTRRH